MNFCHVLCRYERDVFQSFISRGSSIDARCWAVVAVASESTSCASESEATSSDIRGYCLCDVSGNTVRVISLGTAAMYRGQGVGSLLLGHCISRAQERRAVSVSLHVAVDNAAAIALYTRLGFVAVRRETAYYVEDSDDVDAWEMERRLP